MADYPQIYDYLLRYKNPYYFCYFILFKVKAMNMLVRYVLLATNNIITEIRNW